MNKNPFTIPPAHDESVSVFVKLTDTTRNALRYYYPDVSASSVGHYIPANEIEELKQKLALRSITSGIRSTKTACTKLVNLLTEAQSTVGKVGVEARNRAISNARVALERVAKDFTPVWSAKDYSDHYLKLSVGYEYNSPVGSVKISVKFVVEDNVPSVKFGVRQNWELEEIECDNFEQVKQTAMDMFNQSIEAYKLRVETEREQARQALQEAGEL